MLIDKLNAPKCPPALNCSLGLVESDALERDISKGSFIIELRDSKTNTLLERVVKDNVITKDCRILLASLLAGSAVNPLGVTMLAVGTGATGPILTPDAATADQRSLNNEIARKAFSSITFRTTDGVAVAYRTNIVDFTVTFGEGEAVGALNEMGLVSPASNNPTIRNPIPNGFPYDPTVDVSGKDLLSNYATFGVITKPVASVMSFTWRYTV